MSSRARIVVLVAALAAAMPLRAATPAVSASYQNSAALHSDGSVFLWGETPTANVTVPTRAAGLTGVSAISQGNGFTLALRADGTVWSAGGNDFGQLGDGTTDFRSSFGAIAGLQGVASVAVAPATAFAVHSDGTVSSWGSNAYGRLADGGDGDRSRPARVSTLTGVVAIATTGWGHSLALKSDGSVWAWGQNGSGNLGDGTLTTRSTPVRVQGLSGVVAVATGDNHSMALTSDGSVWAWGANAYGQLGFTGGNAVIPARVAGLSGVVAIAGSGDRSLAIRQDGTLWTWGANGGGELGIGDGSRAPVSNPVQITALSNVASVAGSLDFTLAWTRDGSVFAWGRNPFGALGDGTLSIRSSPVRVLGAGGVGNLNLLQAPPAVINEVPQPSASVTPDRGNAPLAVSLDASDSHDPDGTIVRYEWSSSSGETAVGRQATMTLTQPGFHTIQLLAVDDKGAGAIDRRFVLVTVIASQPVAPAISASLGHTLALKQDGTAWAWGEGSFLGFRPSGSTTFQEVTPVFTGLSGVRSIAAGLYAQSFAVLADGSVFGWGLNGSGELGVGYASSFISNPTRVAIADVIAAGSGDRLGVFLKRDGSVWTTGFNGDGRLGIPAATIARFTPGPVPGLSGIVAIAVGERHALALRNDGSVWAWGANDVGQLGIGEQPSQYVPVRIATLDGVAKISTSCCHSLAARADGSVWAWGENYLGQLGDGTLDARSTPVRVPGASEVADVSAGGVHSLALKRDGLVLSWGGNCHPDVDTCFATGQLGDGTSDERSSPALVPGLDRVAAISAGYSSSMAQRFDGTLLMWGRNETGQLGEGTFASRFLPQLVLGEAGVGFFDVAPGVANQVPVEKVPPFIVLASGIGTGTNPSIDALLKFRPQDIGTTGSSYVFAVAPAESVRPAANGEPGLVLGKARSRDGKETAVSCILAQLNASGQLQAVSASSLQAFVTGVLGSQGQAVTVINGASTVNIGGATFYVGYGPSASSMINGGLNRSVATIPGAKECKPQAPKTGWWWYPPQDGRGYSIEVQGNKIFFAAFLYDTSGRSNWYVATGTTSLDGSLFTGDLLSVKNGQTLFGTYKAPAPITSVGSITLAFNSATSGTMVWPGGTVPLERFNIVPNGLNLAPQENLPETGWWWNPSESGRGFFIEWQGGKADLAGYMYDDSGEPVWYLTVQSTPDPARFAGNWWTFADGQTLLGAWKPNRQTSDNFAPVAIQFHTRDTATLTLPGGRTTNLVRHRF